MSVYCDEQTQGPRRPGQAWGDRDRPGKSSRASKSWSVLTLMWKRSQHAILGDLIWREQILRRHWGSTIQRSHHVYGHFDRRERGFTMFNNESNGPERGTCHQLRKEDVAALAWAGRSRKVTLDMLFALNTTLPYSTGPGSSVLWSVVIVCGYITSQIFTTKSQKWCVMSHSLQVHQVSTTRKRS